MILRTEITEATRPRTRTRLFDLDSVRYTAIVTTQLIYRGQQGDGQAMYESELRDLQLVGVVLCFDGRDVALSARELLGSKVEEIEERLRLIVEAEDK